jgi:hypothetical protein
MFVNGFWLRGHTLINPKKSCDFSEVSCGLYILILLSSHVTGILSAFDMTLMIYN